MDTKGQLKYQIYNSLNIQNFGLQKKKKVPTIRVKTTISNFPGTELKEYQGSQHKSACKDS